MDNYPDPDLISVAQTHSLEILTVGQHLRLDDALVDLENGVIN